MFPISFVNHLIFFFLPPTIRVFNNCLWGCYCVLGTVLGAEYMTKTYKDLCLHGAYVLVYKGQIRQKENYVLGS